MSFALKKETMMNRKKFKMKINIKYLIAFVMLIIIEALIAIYLHDDIIRPYIGDILVVILMYTFIRAFVSKPIEWLPAYIFAFATAVELAQYFKLVELLNLQNNKFARIIIGSSFDLKDILCYFVGAGVLVLWELWERKVAENGNR